MAISSTVKTIIPYIQQAGNYVKLMISSKAVKMESGNDLETELNNKLFYQQGNVITVVGTAGGYFTSGGRDLVFSVPVGKSLEYIQSAKITKAKLLVRQNDSYCIGTANGHETLNLNTDNPRANIRKDNGSLDIGFTFPKGRAAVNNDACGVGYEIEISLS